MYISRSNNNTDFKPVAVESLDDIAAVATATTYSLSTFKDNYRNLENFEQTTAIGLDVDDGLTIEEAKEVFGDYRHIIMPSRNHRKSKKGVVADRFRVLLFLTEPILKIEDYYETWFGLYKEFPFIDRQCPDPTRMFYKSPSVYSKKNSGRLVTPLKGAPLATVERIVDTSEKGVLSRATLEFFLVGAPKGSRDNRLYRAAKDCQQQDYSEDECVALLNDMASRISDWPRDTTRQRGTIRRAYKKPPRHDKRKEAATVFNFKTISELGKDEEDNVSWLVDDLLTVGGVSLLAAQPKAGKSTLTRQLCKAVVEGGDFLGRQVKKGSAIYLALEEQGAMIKEQFERQGADDTEDLLIHVGSVPPNFFDMLQEELMARGTSLLVVDTLMLLIDVENSNSYDEVNRALKRFRELARATDTHIMFIHHQNKSEGRGTTSVMGSNALHGAVDNLMLFNIAGHGDRLLSTSQRGGKAFKSQKLKFDEKTQSYSIKETTTKGF